MKDEMEALLELAKKNFERCPWVNSQTSELYVGELLSEIEEFNEAYKKKDWESVQEELGDILWDVITLSYLMEKEGKLRASEVIGKTRKKIEWRKPWLLSGGKVTRGEAVRIWKERKNPKP
jgi:NTP pyrophosphatase (non-canonical NTP hydrolase)